MLFQKTHKVLPLHDNFSGEHWGISIFYFIEVSTEAMTFNIQLLLLTAMWDMNWMRPWNIISLHGTSADVNNNLLLQIVHVWTVKKKKKRKFSSTRLIPMCTLQQFSRIINFLFCPQSQSRILWEHPEQDDKLCSCLADQHIRFLLEEEAGWLPSMNGL